MKRFVLAVALLFAAASVAAGCGSLSGQSLETKQQAQDTKSLLLAQPVPHFNYSQLRQNLIELETAQANGVQTTSFFFNQGVRDPIGQCPSIGAPIATTTELTNPQQVVGNTHGNTSIGQMDPTGAYTGQSTGTYVMCIDGNGKTYANYWEGFVQTVFGPATWNSATHQVQLVGAPSFHFSGITR